MTRSTPNNKPIQVFSRNMSESIGVYEPNLMQFDHEVISQVSIKFN
jgi:hypothetical protein